MADPREVCEQILVNILRERFRCENFIVNRGMEGQSLVDDIDNLQEKASIIMFTGETRRTYIGLNSWINREGREACSDILRRYPLLTSYHRARVSNSTSQGIGSGNERQQSDQSD